MKKNNNLRVKKIAFMCIVLLLLFPMIQQMFSIFKLASLKGAYEITTTTNNNNLSFQNWFDGNYQIKKENYLNQHFGFRTFFVRIYNQMHYSLFNTARANSVIVGKKNYLYETNYIDEYLGRKYIGNEKIIDKTRKLKKISDTLKKINIDLMVVFAPGKGSFYPEFIPDKYNPKNKSITNYQVYKNEILSLGIHFLDFNDWFKKMKKKSKYPLFPKTGIHWSKYGEILAADSIINYINFIKKRKSLPEIEITNIMTSKKMQSTDDDIEKGMNLFFDIEDLEMAYPTIQIKNKGVKKNSKVLVVADSYYWGLYNLGISKKVFGNGQFWYYNKEIYHSNLSEPIRVNDIDIKKEIEDNDVIILLCTDANLHKFSFGFIDKLIEVYYNK